MSDIPVGSPPVPPGRHAAPGGWYADPLDQAHERYWDGWQWSRNTRLREGGAPPPNAWPTPSPAPAPGQPYQAGPPQQGPPGPQGYGAPWAGAVPPVKPPLLTADGVTVPTWWWRALAALLDGLFTGILSTLLSLPLFKPMITSVAAWYGEAIRAAQTGVSPPPTPDVSTLITTTDQVLVSLIALAIGLAYQLIFLRRRGATPGKMICGLRVVPVDEGRFTGPLSWRSIVIRALIWVLPGVYSPLFIVTIADILTPLGQPKRQALHDMAARTQVVRRAG